MRKSLQSTIALIVSVGTCLLIGITGALFTASSVNDWYPSIQQPSWTPPSAVFGPVWTLLYILMGTAAWLVWQGAASDARRLALKLFVVQLGLNSLWSALFFGLRSPGWALVEIVVLWGTIVATLMAFARVSRVAAGLLVPYLLWVSFATALNFAMWSLNR